MKKPKKIIKEEYKKIRRRIWELFANPKYTPKPSLNNIDDGLKKYLSYPNGFFIEVGANDGWKQSNTYHLEFGRRWRGILIEAVPELYQACFKLRKRSSVFNYALVDEDYSASNATIHYADLMSVVSGAKDDELLRKHLQEGIACQKLKRTYEINVPARTLASILEECGVKTIDFFSLDVEGYELNVLKGMNLTKYRPKYILVEMNDYEDVNAFLVTQDYRQIDKLSCHDYLFMDQHK